MDVETWHPRSARHEARVDAWTAPHVGRRRQGLSHPVDDFLFTYYSYRPAALRRWHPGVGVTLTGPGVEAFKEHKGYALEGGGARVDPQFAVRQRAAVTSIRRLLLAIQGRPMALSCFGLHEWAMVYRQPIDDLRHHSFPLRLGAQGTADVVQSHRLGCTHFDAFRFFTPAARPLNAAQPTADTRERYEQPGCLHVTMDCYKWAYKLAPFTSADLVADCFELARTVREVDMQASPYDLTAIGVEPLPIETTAGKASYVARQREFADRAGVLRARLISCCDAALEYGSNRSGTRTSR